MGKMTVVTVGSVCGFSKHVSLVWHLLVKFNIFGGYQFLICLYNWFISLMISFQVCCGYRQPRKGFCILKKHPPYPPHIPGNFPTHVYVFEVLSVWEFPGNFPTDIKTNNKKTSTWMDTSENVFEVLSVWEFPGNSPTHVHVFEVLSVWDFPGNFPTDFQKTV